MKYIYIYTHKSHKLSLFVYGELQLQTLMQLFITCTSTHYKATNMGILSQ